MVREQVAVDGQPQEALAVCRLSKTFGGVKALSDVSFSVEKGSIHGLLGHNGSGKSTLIKILAGYHQPDHGGRLSVYGHPVPLPITAAHARELGLGFVHQDLGLVLSLSVTENFNVTNLATQARWGIRWRPEQRRVADILQRYGLRVAPDAPMALLSPAQRAIFAIVRTTHEIAEQMQRGESRPGVLVLDEPTASLPREGVEQLFATLREVAANGMSVVLVTHKLDEVREITDRVTVLRDGKAIFTGRTHDTTQEGLVALIVGDKSTQGKTEATEPPHTPAVTKRPIVVDGLVSPRVSVDHLELAPGEVVGATGLIGAGFTELLYALFGASSASAGVLRLSGMNVTLASLTPFEAINLGIGLVPGDRLGSGAVASLPASLNIGLHRLRETTVGPWLSLAAIKRRARTEMREFSVLPPDPNLILGGFSGGNQQKIVLAKWIKASPRLLLLDEPTQGVDVGARNEISRIIREVAQSGASVLCASADYEQLVEVSDRVLIFADGTVVNELPRERLTKEALSEACLNSTHLSLPAK